jgi:putative inorganic carbon (HCO3(-)) transporter
VSSLSYALERELPPTAKWIALAAPAGVVLGIAAAFNPMLAVGFAVAFAFAIGVAVRPSSLLLVLVAAVFVELIQIGGVTITRLVAPIALVVVLAAAVKREYAIRAAPPLAWAIGYALWALASGLWSGDKGGTIYLLSSLAIALVFMAAFASMLTTRAELERILTALAILSFVLGVLSILAFIGRPLLGFGVLQEGRSQGGTGDPSFFAATQLIALPLILVLAANTDRLWYRNALYAVALANLGSVLTTNSRGGTIQLALVMILLLALPARTIFRSVGQKRLALTGLTVGLTIFFVHYSADLLPRLETIWSRSQDQTGSGRLAIWPAAWDAFYENPVTGIGYGVFINQSVDRILDSPESQITGFNVHPEEVHNVFLGTATELGVVGLALFLGLLASTARMLRRAARRAREQGAYFVGGVADALFVGLLAWCVGSLFIETETSRPLWILIGICLALPKLIPEPTPEPEPPLAPGLG